MALTVTTLLMPAVLKSLRSPLTVLVVKPSQTSQTSPLTSHVYQQKNRYFITISTSLLQSQTRHTLAATTALAIALWTTLIRFIPRWFHNPHLHQVPVSTRCVICSPLKIAHKKHPTSRRRLSPRYSSLIQSCHHLSHPPRYLH